MKQTVEAEKQSLKQEAPVDHTLPEGKWSFDANVSAVFENMLSRSIPQYEVMRRSCYELACKYVQPQTDIVDLGCSQGDAISQLVYKYGANNRFIGVEISPPMLQFCRERFEGYIRTGVVDIREQDLRTGYPPARSSVTLAILTIQFTPIEYRQRLIQDIYQSLLPGGAFILVEKILGRTVEIDSTMTHLYYKMKQENGYSQEEIVRKKLSLEGVLVPVTAKWNEDLLHFAGFSKVDCFWRWMNFAGWIAVK